MLPCCLSTLALPAMLPGIQPTDTHLALLISNPLLKPAVISDTVTVPQVRSSLACSRWNPLGLCECKENDYTHQRAAQGG
jgi:hypothetical protein